MVINLYRGFTIYIKDIPKGGLTILKIIPVFFFCGGKIRSKGVRIFWGNATERCEDGGTQVSVGVC